MFVLVENADIFPENRSCSRDGRYRLSVEVLYSTNETVPVFDRYN